MPVIMYISLYIFVPPLQPQSRNSSIFLIAAKYTDVWCAVYMYAKPVTHCHTHIDETYYVDCLEELSDFLAWKRIKLCLSSINRVTFAEREFSRVGYVTNHRQKWLIRTT